MFLLIGILLVNILSATAQIDTGILSTMQGKPQTFHILEEEQHLAFCVTEVDSTFTLQLTANGITAPRIAQEAQPSPEWQIVTITKESIYMPGKTLIEVHTQQQRLKDREVKVTSDDLIYWLPYTTQFPPEGHGSHCNGTVPSPQFIAIITISCLLALTLLLCGVYICHLKRSHENEVQTLSEIAVNRIRALTEQLNAKEQ